MTASPDPSARPPGRPDASHAGGDTLRAMIGRGNCRHWRRPALDMVYRLNYPRRHLVLVAGDLLDDRVWAALDEDGRAFAEIGWEVRVLPAPLRGKVAAEPDSPPAAPAAPPRGAQGEADPHADANRRAAASFARWCEKNPAEAREVMGRWHAGAAAGPHPAGEDTMSAAPPPTGLNLNPPYHPDGRVFSDAEVAAIAAGNPHLFSSEPAADRDAAAADRVGEQAAALERLQLVGGLLALAARMAGQFAERLDGCCDGCCYPLKSSDPLEPDDAARGESVARRKLAQTVAHQCGWAADALNGLLPEAFAVRAFSDADALRLMAAVADRP